MKLVLAPMEGLLDFVLRDILTRIGGVDRCVSEFIRITDQLLPERVFLRIVPELAHGGLTPAGVPVRGQLLGSDPSCMADNAARLAAMGSPGIDLNFGCPAKIVNRHGGGAALLQDPELVARIVAAVRRAVPAHIPVSAKMRLGFHDDLLAEVCAQAIAEGGASELVVHARTRAQAYRPPAYWERIADIRAVVRIPVIANGEIWNLADALRCAAASGCDSLMLGRGAVADPGLGQCIKAWLRVDPANGPRHPAHNPVLLAASAAGAPTGVDVPLTWDALVPHLNAFWALVCSRLEPRARAGRLKQWLNFLRRRFPEAELAYQTLKGVTDPAVIDAWLVVEAQHSPPLQARQTA